MKNLKRLSSLLLVMLLIIMLCACGSSNPLAGKWNYDLSFKGLVESTVKENVNMTDEKQKAMYDELFKAFDDCSVILTLEFNEDGTYNFAPDKDSADAAIKKIKENLKTVLPNAYKAMGFTDAQFEQYLASQGKTLDQMVEEVASQFNVESLTGSEASGNYSFEDGKLYLYDGDEKDDSKYLEIELGNNEFKVTKVEGDISGFKGVESLLPMTFKKA